MGANMRGDDSASESRQCPVDSSVIFPSFTRHPKDRHHRFRGCSCCRSSSIAGRRIWTMKSPGATMSACSWPVSWADSTWRLSRGQTARAAFAECWHSARSRRWGREKVSRNALLRRLAGQHGAASTDSQNRCRSCSARPTGTHAAQFAAPAWLIQDRSSTVFPLPGGADTRVTRAEAPSRPTSRGRETIASAPGRAAPPEPTADPTTYATSQIIAPGPATPPVCRLLIFCSPLVHCP